MLSLGVLVNLIGALVVGASAVLLLRAYGRVRRRLLLWSGLCFAGLTVANALMVIDLAVLGEEVSLYVPRLAVASLSMLTLVYGLVWDSE